MSKQLHLRFIALGALMMTFAACEVECPDLLMPQYVYAGYGDIVLEDVYEPLYIGSLYYPMGARVTLYGNSYNEYYSLRRYDSWNNSWVTFFWNTSTYPYFFSNDPNSLYRYINPGELITVYRVVFNTSDCTDNGQAPQSVAKVETVVKVQNGAVVETHKIDQDVSTPTIRPQGYGIVKAQLPYKGAGIYTNTFYVDYRNDVNESDESNNTYNESPTDSLIRVH